MATDDLNYSVWVDAVFFFKISLCSQSRKIVSGLTQERETHTQKQDLKQEQDAWQQ